MENRTFECTGCGHVWSVPPCTEGGKHGYEIACPECGGLTKSKIMVDGSRSACGGHGHAHGAGHGCGCRHGK